MEDHGCSPASETLPLNAGHLHCTLDERLKAPQESANGIHDIVPSEREGTLPITGEAACGVAKTRDVLHVWLAEQLAAERVSAVRNLEERHESLLDRFKQELYNHWLDKSVFEEVPCKHAMTESVISDTDSTTMTKPRTTFCNIVDIDVILPENKRQRSSSKSSTSSTQIHETDADGFAVGGEVSHHSWGNSGKPRLTKSHSVPILEVMKTLNDVKAQRSTSSVRNSVNVSHHLHHFESTVRGQMFEWTFAAIILANALVMAMQQQFRGLELGYELEYRTYNRSAQDAWPGGEVTFWLLERGFTLIFTLEILMRFYAYKAKWFCETWSYVDLIVVGFAWVTWLVPDQIMMNPTFLRLARFGKLMRIVRLLRSNTLVESLKLLVASIRASVNTLFWSLCVLLLIQSLAGMFLSQMLERFVSDKSVDLTVRQEVFSYFGTFWRAMITMFEITFANWAPSCRLLINHVDEGYGTFFLIYRCVIGFSVLLVIQAVFIQQTMKTAQLDDDFLAQQKAREKKKMIARLQNIFHRLDESGDGYIDCNEFVPALQDGHMKGMLETFDLEVQDFYTLFEMLVDEDGRISSEAFVRGVSMMKGPAKAVDMMEVLHVVNRLEGKLDGVPPTSLMTKRTTYHNMRSSPSMAS